MSTTWLGCTFFELACDDGVDGKNNLTTLLLGLRHDVARDAVKIGLGKRLADHRAHRLQERVGHAAADDQRVDLGDEVCQHRDFRRDLGAADDGRGRTASVFRAPSSVR